MFYSYKKCFPTQETLVYPCIHTYLEVYPIPILIIPCEYLKNMLGDNPLGMKRLNHELTQDVLFKTYV